MQKTPKLFDQRNKEKKTIEFSKKKRKRVNIGEIWICKIWINIGSEISKDWKHQRPVLIISNYLWWDLVLVTPMTTKYNKNYEKNLFKITDYQKFWLNKQSFCILNQTKTISIKRLIKKINNITVAWNYITKVPQNILTKIKNLIKEVFYL